MSARFDRSRRIFAATATGMLTASVTGVNCFGQQQDGTPKQDSDENRGPVEADFTRDYDPPGFKPKWKRKQINRTMAADFVIYAHSDLDKVKMLLDREPGLLNSALDWGAGDWETALGGASHMGRDDIVRFLLSRGARMDIFCAAMMGMLGTVREMLTLEPALINAKGPHGFDLYFHAQLGEENSKPVLDYLQSVRKVELRPNPILMQKQRQRQKQK